MAQVVQEPILHICIEMHERLMYFTLLPCFFLLTAVTEPCSQVSVSAGTPWLLPPYWGFLKYPCRFGAKVWKL